MLKTRYIHIGYPKAASTTLQNDFFAQHPQLHHLGFKHKHSSGNYQNYIDDDINIALEMDLRCKKDLLFDVEKTKKIFDGHFLTAENNDAKKLVGISFEGLCYTNTNDIDITQKAERLKNIFGENTKIIIVVREQRDAVKSFYSNSVQAGYFNSYKKFIEYLLLYQFRSIISDFKYYDVYKLYAKLFGKNNVFILPFELLKYDANKLQNLLCEFLEIDNLNYTLSRHNTGHSKASIQYNRFLNYLFRHNLGKPCMSDVFSFRYETYFKNTMDSKIIESISKGNKTKKNNINMARLLAKIPFSPECDFDVVENYLNEFRKLFADQNRLLGEEVDWDLGGFGYLV